MITNFYSQGGVYINSDIPYHRIWCTSKELISVSVSSKLAVPMKSVRLWPFVTNVPWEIPKLLNNLRSSDLSLNSELPKMMQYPSQPATACTGSLRMGQKDWKVALNKNPLPGFTIQFFLKGNSVNAPRMQQLVSLTRTRMFGLLSMYSWKLTLLGSPAQYLQSSLELTLSLKFISFFTCYNSQIFVGLSVTISDSQRKREIESSRRRASTKGENDFVRGVLGRGMPVFSEMALQARCTSSFKPERLSILFFRLLISKSLEPASPRSACIFSLISNKVGSKLKFFNPCSI